MAALPADLQRELAQAYTRQKRPVPEPAAPAAAGRKKPGRKPKNGVAAAAGKKAREAPPVFAPPLRPGQQQRVAVVLCSNCEEVPATVRCRDCQTSFCDTCDGPLHLARAKRGHSRQVLAAARPPTPKEAVIVLDEAEPPQEASQPASDPASVAASASLQELQSGVADWMRR